MPAITVGKDAIGHELRQGDLVTYIQPNSVRLRLGYVHRITGAGASVKPLKHGKIRLVPRASNQLTFVTSEYQHMPFTLVVDLFAPPPAQA